MIVLGSTGSIGVNALEIAAKEGLEVKALACGKNIKLLNKQIKRFKPSFVCIQGKNDISSVEHGKVFYGQDGLIKLLNECESDLVLNALVGFAGLRASYHTQKLGKTLALANKESLVVGGKFLNPLLIRPVDSEHCALNALIQGRKDIKRLYITASGGAFYNKSLEELKSVKAKDALKHPNWSMGAKITIDSATMLNKLFELLEAFWLYKDLPLCALIERNSLVHALCEFKDLGISAYFSTPDMKLSIAQAILNKNDMSFIKPLDLLNMPSINFEEISFKKYPLFSLKDEVLKNPDLGVVINAANEVLVEKFLKNEIEFLEIYKGIFKILDKIGTPKITEFEELFEMDKKIRFLTGEI